jgi:cytidylate kinase
MGIQRIFLEGEDVTEKIRTAEVGKNASAVAVILPVREKLVQIQRELAEGTSVIMDGRDIGTNVLPNAQVKIYLNAGVEERARRRCGELEKLGAEYNFEDIKKQIIDRDYNDMNRATAPLKQADDAVLADTSGNTFEQSLELLLKLIKEGLEGKV